MSLLSFKKSSGNHGKQKSSKKGGPNIHNGNDLDEEVLLGPTDTHNSTNSSILDISNDLLGLHGSQESQSDSHSQKERLDLHPSPTRNELLHLNYKPSISSSTSMGQVVATADLLGSSTSNDSENGIETDNQTRTLSEYESNILKECEARNFELLSLHYNHSPKKTNTTQSMAMQLNDAYIALEQMRVANLQIEFGTSKINEHKCVQCIRKLPPPSSYSNILNIGKSFRWKNDKPCLMCGSPTCKKHADPSFMKSKIAICSECSPLFSLDFILECVCLNIASESDMDNDGQTTSSNEQKDHNETSNDNNHDKEKEHKENEHITNDNKTKSSTFIQTPNFNNKRSTAPPTTSSNNNSNNNNNQITPKERLRRQNIKHMVDVYDRVHLMLTYSAQFIDETAAKLESNTKREDQVGVTSNSIGIASGLAGVAAAAAVVTPAGPPLIIASLLFGATAQASSSGSKMINYYSTPNQIAAKIISYYNLLKSILVVTNVLKDALLDGNINVEQYVSRMVKAHDESMLQFALGDDDDDNRQANIDDPWENNEVDDLTQMASSSYDGTSQQAPLPQSTASIEAESEVDFDVDDSTNSNIISKPSNVAYTLQGVKEEDESFGDFQEADTKSLASTPSPKKTFPSLFPPSPKNSNPGSPIRNKNNIDEPAENIEKTTKETTKFVDNSLMERNDKAGQLARFYSRTSLAGSSLVGAATVTVFAGAALSLAHVAFEANNFQSTLKRLQAGSPSKRAELLRFIKNDISNLPNTNIIVEEWDKYLAILDERRRKNDG